MNIGIDASVFRRTPTGIYSYVSNLVQWLGQLDHAHSLSLLLYGPASLDTKYTLDSLARYFPHAAVESVWDGWPLVLLSERNLPVGRYGRSIAQSVDRTNIWLWKKLHRNSSSLAFLSGPAMFAAARPKEFDLFHHTFGLMFPLQRRANVLTIYDLIPCLFPEYYSRALSWVKESFASAGEMDLLLTLSENTKTDVIERLGIPAERIRVIPLAAHAQYRPIEDNEQIQATLARYGIADRPYALSLGTLEYRRNLHRLVEAMDLLKKERALNEHRLVLIGTKGESHSIIFETIQRLHLESDVKWLGHVNFDDLPALLNGAELFVYPSLYEGFGLPPLEALACGTPVASSRASSLVEVVGDAAMLFDPCRVEDMASVIGTMLKDAPTRKHFRAKGLLRAKQFSWRRTAEMTLTAYEEARALCRDDKRWKRRRRRRTFMQHAFLGEFLNELKAKYPRHSRA
jgi:glycosyltransferase involved in cell wall biosynthesis